MGDRQARLNDWVDQQLAARDQPTEATTPLTPVSGDASFRRYFRKQVGKQSYIAVDAPPDKENSEPFVRIARAWFEGGIRVPEVIAQDLEQGFMLLEDFGDRQLLAELVGRDAPYATALEALTQIQRLPAQGLPLYDAAVLQREMDLFPDWFLRAMLGLDTHPVFEQLTEVCPQLIASAESQPQVCVHRDYHARNLMPLDDGGLGVIDFQDALTGPVTYDLVSLLRDAYIDWPDPAVYAWVEAHRLRLIELGLEVSDTETFKKQFDLMGMQRQLKVVGIFCRLWLRDGKPGYLNDIPRTFTYLREAAHRYPEFAAFAEALDQLQPLMETHPQLAEPMRRFQGAA